MKVLGIIFLIVGILLLFLTLIGSVFLDDGSRLFGTSVSQLVIRGVVGIILLIFGAFMRKKGEAR